MMQAVSVDIDDWEAALHRIEVPEAALLFLVNERLRTHGRYLDCRISALRYVDGLERNWEVAAFVLGPVDTPDVEMRLAEIGAFIACASEGMDVDWPSIANH
jgi:hypothetical protein